MNFAKVLRLKLARADLENFNTTVQIQISSKVVELY